MITKLIYIVEYVMDGTGTLKPKVKVNDKYVVEDFKHCALKKRSPTHDVIVCWNDDVNDSVTFLGEYYN